MSREREREKGCCSESILKMMERETKRERGCGNKELREELM